MLRDLFFRFNNVDIKDDMQIGLSLKAIEGHLRMDIRESEVDFTLVRPLTEEELEETVFYCKHDVDATAKLVELRKNYLKSKIDIGRLAGIDEVKAMSMTNALTALRRTYISKRFLSRRVIDYEEDCNRLNLHDRCDRYRRSIICYSCKIYQGR